MIEKFAITKKSETAINDIMDQNQNEANDELVINHLENNKELTSKTGLIRSLKKYYRSNI